MSDEIRSKEWSRRVEATPDQVWDAVATGNGMASWFVPAEVDPREGGEINMHLGPDMDAPAKITEWRPPERLVFEEKLGEGEAGERRMLFTEFIVEAEDGGITTLRLVCGVEPKGEDWDEFFESMDEGWGSFLDNLVFYLGGHAGALCGSMMVDAVPDLSPDESFAAMLEKLGSTDAAAGDHIELDPGAGGSVAGTVSRRSEKELAIVIEAPMPGIVDFSAFTWGEGTHARIHARLYGENGTEAAAASSGAWTGWLTDLFPSAEVRGL